MLKGQSTASWHLDSCMLRTATDFWICARTQKSDGGHGTTKRLEQEKHLGDRERTYPSKVPTTEILDGEASYFLEIAEGSTVHFTPQGRGLGRTLIIERVFAHRWGKKTSATPWEETALSIAGAHSSSPKLTRKSLTQINC